MPNTLTDGLRAKPAPLTKARIDAEANAYNSARNRAKRTNPAVNTDHGYRKPFTKPDGGRKIGLRQQ